MTNLDKKLMKNRIKLQIYRVSFLQNYYRKKVIFFGDIRIGAITADTYLYFLEKIFDDKWIDSINDFYVVETEGAGNFCNRDMQCWDTCLMVDVMYRELPRHSLKYLR